MSGLPQLPPEAAGYVDQIDGAISDLKLPITDDHQACGKHARAAILSLQVGKITMQRSYTIEEKLDGVSEMMGMGFKDIKKDMHRLHANNGNGGKTVVRPTKKQLTIGGIAIAGPPGLILAAWVVWQIVKFHMEKGG